MYTNGPSWTVRVKAPPIGSPSSSSHCKQQLDWYFIPRSRVFLTIGAAPQRDKLHQRTDPIDGRCVYRSMVSLTDEPDCYYENQDKIPCYYSTQATINNQSYPIGRLNRLPCWHLLAAVLFYTEEDIYRSHASLRQAMAVMKTSLSVAIQFGYDPI